MNKTYDVAFINRANEYLLKSDPLRTILKQDNIEDRNKLLEYLFDEKKYPSDKAVLYAARYGRLDTVKWLVNVRCCDTTVTDNMLGDDMFFYAVARYRTNVVEWMIENKINGSSWNRVVEILSERDSIPLDTKMDYLQTYKKEFLSTKSIKDLLDDLRDQLSKNKFYTKDKIEAWKEEVIKTSDQFAAQFRNNIPRVGAFSVLHSFNNVTTRFRNSLSFDELESLTLQTLRTISLH